MQKIILVVACLCWVLVIKAQPNINRVEYFFNSDPGFGNGTNIPITPSPSLNDISFSASLAAVPTGLNSMFIRSRDASGKWSLTNRFLFVKGNAVAAAPNINRVEYFINTDPGFGSGTSIPISPSPDLADAPASINLTGVPEGINSLFIRSRDANGKWSSTNHFLFLRTVVPGVNNITRVEYFFDTDPGFGSATPVTIVPGLDITDVSINADIGSLSLGLHSLYIRSRDASGKWSVTNRFLFVKAASQTGLPNITATEYFIDTDPGFGNGVPVALNPVTDLPDFVMKVNITGLAAGNHRLYLRSRDAAGNWSVTNTYSFPIGALVAAPLIAINSITRKIMCGSTQFKVAYHSTGTYVNGNIFSVQLSNAAGSFATPQVIGSLTGTASGLVNCTIPLQVPNGSGYRVRVVSSNPVVTGLTSDTVFTLYRQPRFSDTLAPIVCLGETISLNNVFITTGFTTVWNTPNPAVAPAGTYQLITSNTALCRDTTIVTVQQDVARWTGAVSSNWHNAGNWNTGSVPGEKTHVIVPGGTPNPCIISTADIKVASIQARNGAIVQTAANRVVELTGKCATLPPN
jgi:hypothetical protein